MRRTEGQSGFTVLEALVALAIITALTGAVFSLFAASRSLQARSIEKLNAALLARSLLGRVGIDIPLNPGSLSDVLDDGRRWGLDIRAFPQEPGASSASESILFDVLVFVEAPRGTDRFELRTILRRSHE